MHDDRDHYHGDGCGHEHIAVTTLAHHPDDPPHLIAGAPLDEVGQIAVLRLQPDDRLAITVDWTPSPEAVTRLRDTAASWAGIDPDRVIVLDGVELTVLRPEEDPHACADTQTYLDDLATQLAAITDQPYEWWRPAVDAWHNNGWNPTNLLTAAERVETPTATTTATLSHLMDRSVVTHHDAQPDDRCWKTTDDGPLGYSTCNQPSDGPTGLCTAHRDQLAEVTP